ALDAQATDVEPVRGGIGAQSRSDPPASSALPPRLRKAETARRLRRARRRPLRLREPSEPGNDTPARERALVARSARSFRPALSGRRGAVRAVGARQRIPQSGRRGRRLLLLALPVRK